VQTSSLDLLSHERHTVVAFSCGALEADISLLRDYRGARRNAAGFFLPRTRSYNRGWFSGEYLVNNYEINSRSSLLDGTSISTGVGAQCEPLSSHSLPGT